MRRATLALGSLLLTAATLTAQNQPVEFEVVSIKRSPPDAVSSGMQTLPDGSFSMRNSTIRSIILAASPVPAREVEGLPAWAERDRYDITAKAPAGATQKQSGAMMRRVFEDRMKLKGHIGERERTVFALVLARSDGRLGPQLKPATLDCLTPAPPRSPDTPLEPPESRCGGSFGRGQIVSGGITMDQLVLSLGGLAGGQVINRTGLQGYYALTLRYTMPPAPGAEPPPADAAPDPITAIQEQLGLKFQPEKMKVPVFVVDSIERPSEN